MILITSAQYCNNEITDKVSHLPLAFLPVGNKRLYELQIDEIKKSTEVQNIFMSLPDDYKLSKWDQIKLKSYDVRILTVQTSLNLADSINYCLKKIDIDEPLIIYLGDSLINYIDLPNQNSLNYCYKNAENSKKTFYNFSNKLKLIECIDKSIGNLSDAIDTYNSHLEIKEIITDRIYNFDTVDNYYYSKSLVTTQRIFNEININGLIVEKKSSNHLKIAAEVNWYTQIPSEVKQYTPKFLGEIRDDESKIEGYKLEYLFISSINDLYVFGKASIYSWKEILKNCFKFIKICNSFKSSQHQDDHKGLYFDKVIDRLKIFAISENLSLDKPIKYNNYKLPCLAEIINDIYLNIAPLSKDENSIYHGDLCFSNVFYDFEKKIIKVIDPRGIDSDNNLTIYGDTRYDLAKIAHSLIGYYDHIIAGHFKLNNIGNDYSIEIIKDDTSHIEEVFWQLIDINFPSIKHEIYPIMIGLFLSMVPLHSDRKDRQYAFIANALRLYIDYKKVIQ